MSGLSYIRSLGFLILWAFLSLHGGPLQAAGEYAGDTESPSPGGALIFGTIGEARSLDPGVVQEKTSALVTVNIYENLVRFERDSFRIRPALASRWTVSSDNRIWTFTLRKNVKFHDGSALDAWAVKFNFDRQGDPRHPFHYTSYGRFLSYRSLFGSSRELIDKVEVVDPLTIRFCLTRPCVPFLRTLALYPFAIVSPASVKKWKDEYYCHPSGTGPFRFLEWRRGQRIVLIANRDYWGTHAYLERVIFEPFADNISSQRLMERHNIDFMTDVAYSCIDDLKQDPDITVAQVPGLHYAYVAINCQRPPFNQKSLRQALNYLVNRKGIVEVLGKGRVIPAVSPIPPGIAGHSRLGGYAFEPSRGASIMKKARLRSNPVFIYPDIAMACLNNPEAVAGRIGEYLQEGGTSVSLQKLPYGEFVRRLRAGEFELALWGTIDETGDPDALMIPPFDPANAFSGGTNVCSYQNSRIHELLWKARSTEDKEKRGSLYRTAAEIITGDAPSIPLVYGYQVVAYNRKLRGIALHPSGLYDLATVWREK